MSPLPQDKSHMRFEALDSLRFFAAMIALVAHAREMHDQLFPTGLLASYFFHRKSAVAFFFVLSGFVLHLSCRGTWPTLRSWVGFMIRRVFRLHPLYLASLVVALLVSFLPLQSSIWYQENTPWRMTFDFDHTSFRQWIHHFLLVTPGIDPNFLNPPIWTLAVEMKMALVFPWVSWLISKFSLGVGLIVIAGLMLGAPQLTVLTTPTMALLPLFMIGAWGSQHYQKIGLWLKSRINWRSFVLLAVGLTIFGSAAMLRGRDAASKIIQYQAAGIGALMVMLAVIHIPSVTRFLSMKGLVLGGSLSYGIYVFHYPIYLGLLCCTGPDRGDAVMFFFIGLGITWLLAWLLNRTLEVPMIRAGRFIALRFSGSPPPVA